MAGYQVSHCLVCSNRQWRCTISATVWCAAVAKGGVPYQSPFDRGEVRCPTGQVHDTGCFLKSWYSFRQLETPNILQSPNFHESIHKNPPTRGLNPEFFKPSRYSHTVIFVTVVLFSHITPLAVHILPVPYLLILFAVLTVFDECTLRVLSVHRSFEVFALLGCYAVLKLFGQPIGPTVSGEA